MAHPASPPQPDPEKQQDRIITWRAAILTTIAGLLVAAISAGSAIVGVFITSRNSAEQARDEFLRDQRRDAYAQFLRSYDDIFDDLLDMHGNYEAVTPAEADELSSRLDGIYAAYTVLELFSGRHSEFYAHEMYQQLIIVTDGELWGYCTHQIPPPPAAVCEEHHSPHSAGATDAYAVFNDMAEQRASFVSAIRAELGVD
jgi:hypothetical protein